MKALLLTGVMVLGCSAAAYGDNRQFVAADDRMETQVCIDAATKSMRSFSQKLHNNRLNYRIIGKQLLCNDEAVATFAARYNPDQRVSSRIARYSPEAVKTQVKITELASLSGPLVIFAN
ncbi:DUF3718 domain-containing protein [uncultured Ferrimonas sp.]|uniref:DUF3718 domain-containing protein n=1 Tax=uncultured Ferrimonas sp. TaxID=432640 RepID=UPI002630917C|nr:DUF3718 domain-containing protein [uncultured Ferrimonas sp.]